MDALRILAVDDDEWVLEMVATVLAGKGYSVDTAHDGEEALSKAIASSPSLIITDILMPKMDGWALLSALRERDETARTPVLVLTHLDDEDSRVRGFELGADDFVTKPFRFDELALRVERTLSRRQQAEDEARERFKSAPAPKPRRSASGEHPSLGLAGRIEQLALSALLVLLEMERKSGILLVTQRGSSGDGDTASMYISAGKVLSAKMRDRDEPSNAELVYHLLEWSTGRFEFSESEIEVADEIGSSTSHLLMEGARRIDERNNA